MPQRDKKSEQEIAGLWVDTPEMRHTRRQIEECKNHSKVSSEPCCMFVTGPSGVGKSFLCQVYLGENPRYDDNTRTVVPVLYATTPSPGQVGALASAILHELGDIVPDRGSIDSKTRRLRQLLRECRVEIILLDECQHLAERGKRHVLHQSADWLKNLIAETRIPVVLIGVPYAERLLNEHAQLRNRFSFHTELHAYDWRDKDRQAEFLQFLNAIDERLSEILKASSGLAEKELAIAIYQASSGLPRLFMKLIRSAAIRALEAEAPAVRKEDLAAAYDEVLHHFGGHFPNPFHTPPQLHKLVECGFFAEDILCLD